MMHHASSAHSSKRQTEPIQDGDERLGFSCGQPALDRFFANHAFENDRRGIGKTFVLRGDPDLKEPPILGFYTLSMASVAAEYLRSVFQVRLPRYPMPVALVGRLAIHEQMQGQGLGGFLLADALLRVAKVAHIIGCLGVIVDSKDETAEAFYTKFGFVTVEAELWPRRMFLPIGTLQQNFPDEEDLMRSVCSKQHGNRD